MSEKTNSHVEDAFLRMAVFVSVVLLVRALNMIIREKHVSHFSHLVPIRVDANIGAIGGVWMLPVHRFCNPQ